MYMGKVMKWIGGALIVMASAGVYAQTADMGEAPHASMSKKEMKHADRMLQKKVRAALAKAQGVDTSKIIVRARDGVVTLQGTVPDNGQIEKATQTAQSVAGVQSVDNTLAVKVGGQQ